VAGDIYVTVVDGVTPVSGVTIKLYEDDGAFGVYLAEDITNASGIASFVGYADDDYFVRTRVPPSAPFTVPAGLTQSVTVAGSDISVTISTSAVTRPTSSDARFCRCWGYFTDITGSPLRGAQIYFSRPSEIPAGTVDTSGNTLGILGLNKTLRLSQAGYGEIDLPRGAELTALIPDYIDEATQIFVPDSASTNLADILFPYPLSIVYKQNGIAVTTVTFAAGGSATVDVEVTLRSGVLGCPMAYFIEAPSVTDLTIQASAETLVFSGSVVGTYPVLPVAVQTNYLLPTPTISGTLSVEVT